jgi:molecular chaperone HscC
LTYKANKGENVMAAIGIDLGTTNSLVAIYEDNKPKLILNTLGEPLTPSVVSLGDDDSIITGAAAKDRLLSHANRTVGSFKRFMGSNHITKLGKKDFRPEELSAFILRALKADVESHLGQAITEAVISVPAYFNDQQRKATMDAGKLAGLNVERLVNEPTAAALAYGLSNTKEGNYLVFDLGGGTFDVSILDKYDDVMEIRATTGDTRLGGDDFTQVVQGILVEKQKLDLKKLNPTALAVLLRQAEKLKYALTKEQSQEYEMNLDGKALMGEISRQEFEAASASLLQRLRQPTERAVRDASIAVSSFDAIVMVGGATRMPMVRSLVARMFGRLPLINIDPDTTIALGAAIQSGLIQRNGALRDVVMTDVCPYTLGVATVDDIDSGEHRLSVSPIIERNAVVPISRNMILNTVLNNQQAIAVQVYQGENLRPENNIHLGTLEMKVPRKPRGQEQVDIRFTYDVNGTLQVEATVLSTKKTSVQVFGNTTGLSETEITDRFRKLEALKLPPREHMENLALIARAERIYEECRGEQREYIKEIIAQFEREISNQQLRNPEACRKNFDEQLDLVDLQPSGLN